jgi:glucose-6-phosphate 1-dehydrogenase
MAAWRVVEPVLGNVVPAHEYEQGSWGPAQALPLAGEAGWYDPRAKEPRERQY